MMKGKRQRQEIKNATWKTKAEMRQAEQDEQDKAKAREMNSYQEQRRDKYGRIVAGQARIVPVQTNASEGAGGVSKKVSKDRRKKLEPWERAKREREEEEKEDQKQRELAAAEAIAEQLEEEQSGKKKRKKKKDEADSDEDEEEESWRHGRKAKKKKMVDGREYRPGLPSKPDEAIVCKRRFWATVPSEDNMKTERHEGDVLRAALDIVVLEGIDRCPPPVQSWDDPRNRQPLIPKPPFASWLAPQNADTPF